MPTEPNTPQPLIPFKMPHLTPVLDAPSPLVPESAAFMNFQVFQTEKANLEFMPVKFRTPEHRARLVIVKAQCEELEKQVMLERMVAQIVQLRQEIKALARPRKQGRKPGQIGARTRKQRLADHEVIAVKQAELTKLETAKAQLSGIAQVTELAPMTRNQFLKMVGMTVLAFSVWNEAAANSGGGYLDSVSGTSFTGSASASITSKSAGMDDDLFDGRSDSSAYAATATLPTGFVFSLSKVRKGSSSAVPGVVHVHLDWTTTTGHSTALTGDLVRRTNFGTPVGTGTGLGWAPSGSSFSTQAPFGLAPSFWNWPSPWTRRDPFSRLAMACDEDHEPKFAHSWTPNAGGSGSTLYSPSSFCYTEDIGWEVKGVATGVVVRGIEVTLEVQYLYGNWQFTSNVYIPGVGSLTSDPLLM